MTTDQTRHIASGLLSVGVALIGAVTDVRSRLIPNRLTGPASVAGLLLHLACGGWSECGWSMLALLVCGGVFLVFHLAGGMGAGDVKLIAAEGCLLGITNVGSLLVYTALCGGILGLFAAASRGKLRETLANVLVLTSHHAQHGLSPHPDLNVGNDTKLRLPYALAIAAGVFLTVVLSAISRTAL